MDRHDYHFISLKFLTAIIMALFFAFLLIYVFSPNDFNYQVYDFKAAEPAQFSDSTFWKAESSSDFDLNLKAKNSFETKLKERSFKLMDSSQKAVLAVITGNYLEKINNLQKDEDLALNQFRLELEAEQEKLLQAKRKNLESNLTTSLQKLRQQVKAEYSDYSQQKIRDNYLQIINLRIGIEVLAQDEAEADYYKKKLAKVEAKQQKLLGARSELINEDISEQTRSLILDFNQEFANYRQKLRQNYQQELALKEKQIELSLSQKREKIRDTLKARRQKKYSQMAELITKAKKYY